MVALEPRVVQELQLRYNLPMNVSRGILVFRMVQDSPADKAGIRYLSTDAFFRSKPWQSFGGCLSVMTL
jgi:hypothetical protein